MSARKNLSIFPGPERSAVSERKLASGQYRSSGEAARAGLYLLDEGEKKFAGHHDAWAAIAVETTAQEPLTV